MFTGIIQEVGIVKRIVVRSSLSVVIIESSKAWETAKNSESIAVNGVCLTLVKRQARELHFQAIKPTLLKTNLKRLKIADKVNLEAALCVGDKLGGHFVLGHVDCEAKIKKIIKQQEFWQIEVDTAEEAKKYMIANGSIALDGVSLTIKKILPRSFTVDIIPFTFEHTNLKYKKIGSFVNIEFDYLLKKKSNE